VAREHLTDEEDFGAPRDRFADYLFGAATAAHFRSVDECHAECESKAKRGDLAYAIAPIFAHAPRALTQRGDRFAGGKCHGADVGRCEGHDERWCNRSANWRSNCRSVL
jgi:hypothetical protein